MPRAELLDARAALAETGLQLGAARLGGVQRRPLLLLALLRELGRPGARAQLLLELLFLVVELGESAIALLQSRLEFAAARARERIAKKQWTTSTRVTS